MTSKKISKEIKKLIQINDVENTLVPYEPSQRPPKPLMSALINGTKIIMKYILCYVI